MSGATGLQNHFKEITSFDVDYAPTTVKKWQSERTGLQITLIKQQTPMVYGSFAVATEVEDDSGTPHTLEHLVFMGSKKYPYKGLLDILGNLHFSSTNAWTATDKTVYTLETAGWEGFNKLLPVYLDHVVNPTLTEEACYTEVYHIDGEGKDKGVVYSEMEGMVYESWFITDLEARKTVYHPKSGYSSETGGLLPSLRVLSSETIKEFHKKLYRPSNLCVIIAGAADEEELLETMTKFDSELPELPETPKPRPFIDSPDPIILKETVVKNVEFPDTDESSGGICIGWNGPEFQDAINTLAFEILLAYLTEDSVSLIQNKIVEIKDPLAGDVGYTTYDFTKCLAIVYADGVPTESLEDCEQTIIKVIKEHYEKDEFDLNRLKATLDSSRDRYTLSCETNPNKIIDLAVSEFVYGRTDGSDLTDLKGLDDYVEISKWPREQWITFYKKYLIDAPHVSVIGKPSTKLYEQKKEYDEKFIKDRIAKLGEKGLEELKRKLQKAEDANNKEIPKQVLDGFGKSDLTKIDFIRSYPIITTEPDYHKSENPKLHQQVFGNTPADFPLKLYFDGFKSNFVKIKMMFSGLVIPEELLPYMFIFQEFFTNPMELDDGTELTYEEVVDELKKDLINYSFCAGYGGGTDELMTFEMQLKTENYDNAIGWIANLFFNSKFDQKRVKVAIDKFLNSLPDSKRDGHTMLSYLSSQKLLSNRSLVKAYNILEIESFYRELAEKIDTADGYEQILGDLEEIRASLFRKSHDNFRIAVFGGVEKLDTPVSSWNRFIHKFEKHSVNSQGKVAPIKLSDIPRPSELLSPKGAVLGNDAYLLATPGSESSYMYVVNNLNIDFLHEDYPAALLVKSYLGVTEGPFWKSVRGAGLAYSIFLSLDVYYKEVLLTFYKATDVLGALKATEKVVRDFATGTEKFDPTLIDGAICSIVNTYAARDSNLSTSAVSQYKDLEIKQIGADFKNKLFARLKEVTVDDMVRVTKKYFVSLFEVESSSIFVTFNPKNGDILEKIDKEGYKVHYSVLEGAAESDEEGSEEDSGEDSGEEEDDD